MAIKIRRNGTLSSIISKTSNSNINRRLNSPSGNQIRSGILKMLMTNGNQKLSNGSPRTSNRLTMHTTSSSFMDEMITTTTTTSSTKISTMTNKIITIK